VPLWVPPDDASKHELQTEGERMKTEPKQHFEEIPNTPEGWALIDQMKKHLGKRYIMKVRGQHLKPELAANGGWRKYQYGQGIGESTHLRLYLIERKQPTPPKPALKWGVYCYMGGDDWENTSGVWYTSEAAARAERDAHVAAGYDALARGFMVDFDAADWSVRSEPL
jgi:hypothetical protein